ncbi:uncharacterized protein HMPREF1541_02748 [Cyphellophora europaea CBS 101466]|uniref:Cell cycle inhibitor Nif1 n=1 Tax=Cyphellophora europaea (strain CBS 101466) TaxID=1220924 RepID=W2S6N1_CYPE1|nr:uncharacterized protein HMPREF1541_02748 [Cyphellophora europaea CBS 101466]ETN43589.1 hypothetical protein HMPREF1541_02748 [Cyphellophora europaea CBS 101466]
MERPRPNFIELPRTDSRTQSSLSNGSGLISPRIQHFDGDIPPALSPLDAFAAQSRRLARELEETRKAGERRMSRLPPQVVSKSLDEHHKNKPQIFRALSSEDAVPQIPPAFRQDSGSSPHVEEPKERPQSSYPRFSVLPTREGSYESQPFMTPVEEMPAGREDYFNVPRAESPASLHRVAAEGSPDKRFKHLDSVETTLSRQHSSASNPDLTFTLAPPNAAFARRPYHESSDDDYTSSNAGSTFSQIPRKLSSSSGVSIPHSPASAYVPSHDRSPSLNSNNSLPLSGGGSRKGRFPLNFSRPMSSASLTNLKLGSPASQDGERGISAFDQGLPTPSNSFDDTRSIVSEGFAGESSSYTHTKWTLPRGRKSDRTSSLFLGLSGPHFEWHDPNQPGTPPADGRPSYELPHASPGISKQAAKAEKPEFAFGFDSDRPRALSNQDRRPSSSSGVANSSSAASSSTVRPRTATTPGKPFEPPPIPNDEVSRSSRSNSTVRPSTSRSTSNYQALSPDDHVTKAIDLHQNGDLKESTYHLRIAAKSDHPTGMLLYALACRHGWGMRPNQQEGATWLRKAVDHAMLEVADDEDPKSTKPKADLAEMKAHKAQFALAIYEIGQCHLNGWGMEQDKALALRCFEIAGNWGDTDALTEAGYCYAEGIGCKKNMKKAAKFYRMAEAKGISMVGNSWIHKDKYNDDDDGHGRKSRDKDQAKEEKKSRARSKSRTRSIFTRKRTVT